MPTYTSNFNLYKPNRADTEEVDTTLSANFDTIDTEIKKRKDELDTHKTAVDAHESVNIKHGDGNVQETLFDLGTRISGSETRVEHVEDRISTIVAQAGTDNTEIVDARGGFTALHDRLENVDSQLAESMKLAISINSCIGANTQAKLDYAVNNSFKKVVFPYNTYIGDLTINGSIELVGNGSTFQGIIYVSSPNVKVTGFKFNDPNTGAIFAPAAGVRVRADDVIIERNVFNYARCYVETDGTDNVTITHNTFTGDFLKSSGGECVTVSGLVKSVRISENDFNINNTRSVIKIYQPTGTDSDIRHITNSPENVVIENNTINLLSCSVISSIISLFSGAKDTRIINNKISVQNATNEIKAIDYKITGLDPVKQVVDDRQTIQIADNIIIGDFKQHAIRIQGTYGLTWENTITESAIVHDNIIRSTRSVTTDNFELISVQGMKFVNIHDNVLLVDVTTDNLKPLIVQNTKNALIHHNAIQSGCIYISENASTTTSDNFTKGFEQLKIESNVVRDWQYLGGIVLESMQYINVNTRIQITNNELECSASTSPTSYPINTNLAADFSGEIKIIGNTVKMDDYTKSRIGNGYRLLNKFEMGNSWNGNGFGTTAQRPTYPYAGQTYFDTTLGKLISYSGSAWVVTA